MPTTRPAPPRPGAPGALRLIAGHWKRRKLPVPDAPGLRPTPERLRGTLFNWLGQDLSGWRCLDAFAGSGALGFEAGSRGAAEVVLLERDARLVAGLRSAQAALQARTLRIEQADALVWMAHHASERFDLVLLDPPFGAALWLPALTVAAPLLSEHGRLYLESDRAFEQASFAPFGLALHRHARAGRVHGHLLRRANTADEAPSPPSS